MTLVNEVPTQKLSLHNLATPSTVISIWVKGKGLKQIVLKLQRIITIRVMLYQFLHRKGKLRRKELYERNRCGACSTLIAFR